MSNFNVTRPGQDNGSGDVKALFLKVFSGEVLRVYQNETIFSRFVRERMIRNGKTAQFPYIGTTVNGYHTPGSELLGNLIGHTETVIGVDNLMVAHVTIPNIDEAMQHYDIRGPYAEELGRALAQAKDKRLARMLVRAARSIKVIGGGSTPVTTLAGKSGAATGTTFTGGSAGYNATVDADLNNASMGTNAATLTTALWKALTNLDVANCPQGGRTIAVKPAQYNLLVSSTSLINKDWASPGAGNITSGVVSGLGGATIVKSNNIPGFGNTDTNFNDPSGGSEYHAATTGTNAYSGRMTTTVALVFGREAVGSVNLMDLATESEYSVSRQGTLFVAKYASGANVLRPEQSQEITQGAIAGLNAADHTVNYLPSA